MGRDKHAIARHARLVKVNCRSVTCKRQSGASTKKRNGSGSQEENQPGRNQSQRGDGEEEKNACLYTSITQKNEPITSCRGQKGNRKSSGKKEACGAHCHRRGYDFGSARRDENVEQGARRKLWLELGRGVNCSFFHCATNTKPFFSNRTLFSLSLLFCSKIF